jgi:hypothetical protein
MILLLRLIFPKTHDPMLYVLAEVLTSDFLLLVAMTHFVHHVIQDR